MQRSATMAGAAVQPAGKSGPVLDPSVGSPVVLSPAPLDDESSEPVDPLDPSEPSDDPPLVLDPSELLDPSEPSITPEPPSPVEPSPEDEPAGGFTSTSTLKVQAGAASTNRSAIPVGRIPET